MLARFKRAWEGRDPDLMIELFAPEAEYRPDPFEDALAGSNAIRAHWNEVVAAQANVEFDAERVWVSGRTVLSSWHAAYTVRATSERFRVRAFSTFELDDDGQVARAREWRTSRSVGTDGTVAPGAGDTTDGGMTDG